MPKLSASLRIVILNFFSFWTKDHLEKLIKAGDSVILQVHTHQSEPSHRRFMTCEGNPWSLESRDPLLITPAIEDGCWCVLSSRSSPKAWLSSDFMD